LNPETLAASAAILFAAYLIRGITGFGSGLIAVPLLALMWPLTLVVPLLLLLDFSASTIMSGFALRQARWREIAWLIPFGIVGVQLGTHLLVNLPQTPMLVALGVFVLLFGLRSLFNLHGSKTISRLWGVPAALTGGAVGALFGTGGPPYVIYLSHRIHDKTALRATFSALFFVDGLTRIVSFFLAGLLLSGKVWIAYLAAAPVVFGGLYLGSRVHVGLSAAQMTRLVGGLLLVAGLSLLFKALR
jgi:uncharacterized membrane protein YfcA